MIALPRIPGPKVPDSGPKPVGRNVPDSGKIRKGDEGVNNVPSADRKSGLQDVRIYPNPVKSDPFTVELPAIAEKEYNVKVFSITSGKIVKESKIPIGEKSVRIDLNGSYGNEFVKPGTYVIQIMADDGSEKISKKITVQ